MPEKFDMQPYNFVLGPGTLASCSISDWKSMQVPDYSIPFVSKSRCEAISETHVQRSVKWKL